MRGVLIALILTPIIAACAPRADTDETPGPRAIVQAVIDEQIIPDYAAFAAVASEQQESVADFCAAPDEAGLETVRADFAELALAWSRVEWITFGPARVDNRREALFFWPDSRGRGLRQAQALAASKDAAQFEPEAFAQKSVVVKGLPALEYVLFGDGAEALLSPGAPRCAFARAIVGAVKTNAEDIYLEWSGAGGYRNLMLEAGPDNPAFKTHKEALQVMLTAASEQVEIVRDLKLSPILRERNGARAPIAPPFAGAGQGIAAIAVNVDSAGAVFINHASRLLPEESAYRASSLAFEIDAASAVLDELAKSSLTIEEMAASEETRGRLAYLLLPLGGAHELMSRTFPADLGLIMGFNSLDGD